MCIRLRNEKKNKVIGLDIRVYDSRTRRPCMRDDTVKQLPSLYSHHYVDGDARCASGNKISGHP